MNIQKKNNVCSPVRLFDNPWLERLTFISFTTFLAVWLPIVLTVCIGAIWHARSMSSFIALGLLGLMTWFLFEYCVHRFLFHFKARTPKGKTFIFLVHGNHHAQPNHPLRSLMPFGASLPLAVVLGALVVGAAGLEHGLDFLSGFLAGYVCYDVTHYACHHFKAQNKIFMMIKRHHLLHHYHDPDMNHAISLPILDKIFLTLHKNK